MGEDKELAESLLNEFGIKSYIDENIDRIKKELEKEIADCKKLFGKDYEAYITGKLLIMANEVLLEIPKEKILAMDKIILEKSICDPWGFLRDRIAEYITISAKSAC